MITRRLLSSLFVAVAFSGIPAMAQESAWQRSYQLEAAGKYAEAMAAIDAVPVNGPEAELRLLRRGWLQYLPGNFDESIREYRLAIERNSRSVDARLGVILPLLAAKRWRDAEISAKSALELSANNYTALVRLAVAQEGQKDWGAMTKTAAALVTGYPTDATAYVYLGRAQAQLGRREDALAAYTAVLVRYPGHLEAKNYIAGK